MLVFAAPTDAHEQRARSPTGKWGGIGVRFRWRSQLARGVISGPREAENRKGRARRQSRSVSFVAVPPTLTTLHHLSVSKDGSAAGRSVTR